MALKSENLNSNSILRLHKENMMVKFMEVKCNEPRITQKQFSNRLGYSDSTIKRYRDDISMDNLYKRSKNRKKKLRKHNPKHTKNENTKNNLKTDSKGGSVLENNHKEDNTKLFTLARKMVDNVKYSYFLNE